LRFVVVPSPNWPWVLAPQAYPVPPVATADTCAKPSYIVHLVYAERYLYRQYGVHTRDLGLYRHQDVRVTEVFCEGRKWPGLGAHVIWVDPERGYAVRDGMWFELRRAAPPS